MINQFNGDYAFLSNFYPSPIAWSDSEKYYPTVEHFFQAYKTWDIDEHEAIRCAATPGEAKRLGRKCHLREDWEKAKDGVMLNALRLKFRNTELRKMLLATGDEFLVEGNAWNDTYWGVCNGKGRNMLGFLLMQLREEIKEYESTISTK